MNKSTYPMLITLMLSSLLLNACDDNDSKAKTPGQQLDGAIAISKTKLAQTQEKTSELYQQAVDSSKETLDEAQVILGKTTDVSGDTFTKLVDKGGELLEQGKSKASELADDTKTTLKKGCEKVKGLMDTDNKDC